MTYVYRCLHCTLKFEFNQRMTDEPVHMCPYCDSDDVERIITGGGGFFLKGDCWAKDSYVHKQSEKKEDGK
jgi:putative FmdB family regulatory protein